MKIRKGLGLMIRRIVSMLLAFAMLILAIPDRAYAGDNIWNSIKDKTGEVKNTVKETTEDAADSVKKGINEAGQKATEAAGNLSVKAAEKANDLSNKAGEVAGMAKDGIQKAYKNTSDYICNYISNIDTETFENGWDTAAQYTTSVIAAQTGSKYVSQVQDAIVQTQKNIQNVVKGEGTTASKAGFVAEEWHTGTFNIDAIAGESDFSAERPASNKKASADVVINKDGKAVQEASLKYYKDGTASAKAQSETIMANYQEYVSKETKKGNTSPLSFNEYLDKNVKLKDAYEVLKSEYGSEYAGQAKIIPSDQLDEATEYLKKKIAKESVKDSPNRKALAKGYEETLDSLADKLTAADGTSSVPLSKQEAEMMVQLVEDGKLDLTELEKKGLKTSTMIKPKYVLRQAVGAGAQAAALEMALAVGPDLFEVIAEGIRNGDIDEDQLKTVGTDAAFAAAHGFAEGSVSAALLTACKAGKLGVKATNASPEVIGTLTVLTIDAINYGYKLSTGEITTEQYGDILAEEIFVAVISQASGVALAALLPFIPGTYMVGSMLGGMLAAEGYKVGKEVVMQVAAGNGFEAIIPADVSDTINIGRETVASLDIGKMSSDLKRSVVTTTNEGLIKIKARM